MIHEFTKVNSCPQPPKQAFLADLVFHPFTQQTPTQLMTIRVIMITIMIIIMKYANRGVELSCVGSKIEDAVTTARVKSRINFANAGSLLSRNITELCAHA